MRQVAEVEYILLAYEALVQQRSAVLFVAALLVHRNQPPDRRAPGEPDRCAVKLVEQQVVLGGAAVVRTQRGGALALNETLRVDQEDMCLGSLGGCPFLQQAALAVQLLQGLRSQVRAVAQPQIHIALLSLRYC